MSKYDRRSVERVAKALSDAEVKCAIYVVATGPGWGPGRNPAWQPRELNA